MDSKRKCENAPNLSKDKKIGNERTSEKPTPAKKRKADPENSPQHVNAENCQSCTQLENIKKEKEEALQSLQSAYAKNDQLSTRLENERKLKEEALIRLSSLASNMLRNNNPNIADLSDPHRPTKLSEQFSELYDNEWTDAFEELQKLPGDKKDKEIISYLLRFLLEINSVCSSVTTSKLSEIQRQLVFPAMPSDENKVNPELLKNIKDEIKSTAPKYIKEIEVHVHNHLKKWLPWKSLESCMDSGNVKRYIDKCTDVCWYMSVQDPQICMEGTPSPDGNFDSSKYKEYTSKGPYEEFVVWPVLYLHRGGPILSKGVAQGSNQETNTLSSTGMRLTPSLVQHAWDEGGFNKRHNFNYESDDHSRQSRIDPSESTSDPFDLDTAMLYFNVTALQKSCKQLNNLKIKLDKKKKKKEKKEKKKPSHQEESKDFKKKKEEYREVYNEILTERAAVESIFDKPARSTADNQPRRQIASERQKPKLRSHLSQIGSEDCEKCQQKKTNIWKLQAEIDKFRNDAKDMQHKISALEKQIAIERSEKEDALRRLSSMASAKLRYNNPNIADLSDPNRPTKIAEKLSEIYDNEWTDAFDHLETTHSKNEEENIQLLLNVIIEIYQHCNNKCEDILSKIIAPL
ncbi:hypothetical protein ACJMK2_030794, partial [Sinanodonta woodiana]